MYRSYFRHVLKLGCQLYNYKISSLSPFKRTLTLFRTDVGTLKTILFELFRDGSIHEHTSNCINNIVHVYAHYPNVYARKGTRIFIYFENQLCLANKC